MPRGDKSKYTDKQERKADHIAEGYEKRGVPEQEAERRAWATVNKDDGGAARSPAGLAAASLPAIRRHIRAARRAVQPPRRAQQRVVRRLRRRQRPHASGTPSSTPDQPDQGC
jgi:plasmid stabilization system protein ParE